MASFLVYSFSTLDVMAEVIENPNGSTETVHTDDPPTDTVYEHFRSYRITVVDKETGRTTVVADDATGYSVDADGYIILFKPPLDPMTEVHQDTGGQTESQLFDIRGSIVVYDAYEKTFTQVTANADFMGSVARSRLFYRDVDYTSAVGDFDEVRYWVDADTAPTLQVDGTTTDLNRNLQVFVYDALERDIRLFSRFADTVSFNALTGVQGVAIAEGADLLHAGDGADTVVLPGSAAAASDSGFVVGSWFYGERGDDVITGGALVDRIDGGAHDDQLSGGLGADELVGGLGDDLLDGGKNNDILSGGGNADELLGGAGNDSLDGGSGADEMAGGAGQDTYRVDSADDQVIETSVSLAASERDTVFSSLTTYTLAANVENLVLADGATNGRGNTRNNAITGNGEANRLQGDLGNDTLKGEGGADSVEGDAGNDALEGGEGNDVLVGGIGTDVMDGNAGADRFVFEAVTESLVGARRDVVTFSTVEGDRIDLAMIDASIQAAGNQAFAWVDAADLDAAFTRVAGQLRLAAGVLMGDTNGDGRADFHIEIAGSLAAGDVIL